MNFARRIAVWQAAHGRHNLPWQQSQDPYRVWVSEIMLQQTQVSTVVPFYERFMARFPDVVALASATLDDVLAQWSGLGYYSRARHLHRAAQHVRDVHSGVFPARFEQILALPGVGRSTAGAIMVFAHGGRYPILDGNVKRVLSRAFGVAGFPGERTVADALWRIAERELPLKHVAAYTQGLMDLGATVCARLRPDCAACPVKATCVAHREGRTQELPAPRPRAPLPHRNAVMLILEHRGRVLLEKRPPLGIWGGLWCLPELAGDADLTVYCTHRFGVHVATAERLPDVEHGFTHFSLTISPRRLHVARLTPAVSQDERQWFDLREARNIGIPAPVRHILERLGV